MRRVVALLMAVASLALLAAERPAELQVDAKARRILLAGKVAKQNQYAELGGAIEYVLVAPGGKEYETLFTCVAEPAALAAALTQIGLRTGTAGTEVDGEPVGPRGDVLRLSVRWQDGQTNRQAYVEEFVKDTQVGGTMPATWWVATGSQKVTDPKTGKPVLEATLTRNLISLHQLDRGVLVQNPAREASANGRYKWNPERVPKEGTPVVLVFEAVALPRWHARVTGTVQGVGYREFARRAASELGIRGWVRNLPNGMVEVLAEAEAEPLAQFRQRLAKGPRGARVEQVREVAFPSTEVLGEFEVRPTPGLGAR